MKILFSDFDGTLFLGGTITEANRDAIHRWRAAGNLFAMATGRHVTDMQNMMAEAGAEYDYLLCLNGSEIFDREGRCLFNRTIDGSLLPGLFEAMWQGEGWVNVCHRERIEQMVSDNCTEWHPRRPRNPLSRMASFPEFSQICTHMADVPAAIAARDRVLARYGDYVSAEINGRSLDVNAAGMRKSTGIAQLLTLLNLPDEAAFAVGDNYNDLCMLTAYQGYAMANGPEEVRAQAKGVVESVAALIDMLL